MSHKKRESTIYEYLIHHSRISIIEAMEMLGVSESTVRRIFINMEKSGKAIRTYGGISIVQQNAPEYSFEKLSKSRMREKQEIAVAASQFVLNGDVIHIDCGTTALAFCLELVKKAENAELKGLQIFTNSLANLQVLDPHFQVILLGGLYRPHRKDFSGYIAENSLSMVHFTKCFVGVDGFTKEMGCCATDFETARLAHLVTQKSDEVFVLCDSTKFGKSSLVNCIHTGAIDYLVTDNAITEEYAAFFQGKDIKLIMAASEEQNRIISA